MSRIMTTTLRSFSPASEKESSSSEKHKGGDEQGSPDHLSAERQWQRGRRSGALGEQFEKE